VAFTALAAPAGAEDGTLGRIDFPVSCDAEAQAAVTEGTLLLHHMMYRMAEARYEAAAEADPACAMAQWGIAMSNFHPLWPGIQSPPERETGLAAIARADGLDAGTARERAYIAAAARFYDPGLETWPARRAAWAEAQRQVSAAHPDDADARAFAALAMLATAPPGPAGLAQQSEAGALLEGLHAEAPEHPGALHYLIHAHDSPSMAEAALPFVEAYLSLAPENPHALHMPSHIMTRLGRWEEAADLNRRSADAVLAQNAIDGAISNHYPHALDYLTYALLQQGDMDGAATAVETLLGTPGMQDVFGTAYAVAAAPARLALEQEDWAAAAALPDIPYDGLEWGRYPHALAIVAFAQGVGAARLEDVDATRAALDRLSELRATMEERGMGYWVSLADAQAGAIEAWVAFEAGDHAAARAMMEGAAGTEDKVGKAPVTPSHVLPIREQLGDMLLLMEEPESAQSAYEAALAVSPNRRRSLAGIAALADG
jgi:tetratricopeptide (TPR) repeat protein